MTVSSTFNGWNYDRQNNRLDYYYRGTRVGSISATGQTLASGMIFDASAGAITLPAVARYGYVPLSLPGFRIITSTDDFNNTATNAGGVLAKNTLPILERVNGATDKAIRIDWATNDVIEITTGFAYPTDLDAAQPVVVELQVAKSTNTNTTTNLAVGYFEGIGDTNAGTSTAAFAVSTLATYTVTIAASDVGPSPAFASISLKPAAHANDAIYLYGAAVRYTRLTA
jgi:hypothetical protein